MATHPIGQHKTTKNPQSLMLCGFLDFIGHCWTGIWWSWGSLNQLLMLLILNGLAVSSLTAVLPLVLLVIKSPHIFAIVAYRSTPRKSQPGCRLLRALATNF